LIVNHLLLIKLLIAPSLIAVATVVSRRWGPAAGGWIAGLPLTSGPLSLIFALEFGHEFARRAAEATILGLSAVVIFAAAYARIAVVRSPVVSLCGSLGAYLVAAAVLRLLPISLMSATGVLLAVIGAAMVSLGSSRPVEAPLSAPPWDIPSRMAVSVVIVLALAFLGSIVSPELVGLLSPFPVFAGIMGVFTHLVGGWQAAQRLLRGIVLGSLAFGTFFVVVASLVGRMPLAICYGIASGAALAVNAGLLLLTAREG